MKTKTITVQEAAAALNLSVATIRNYIRDGKLKAVKLGRVWRIKESDLNALAERGIEGKPQGMAVTGSPNARNAAGKE